MDSIAVTISDTFLSDLAKDMILALQKDNVLKLKGFMRQVTKLQIFETSYAKVIINNFLLDW